MTEFEAESIMEFAEYVFIESPGASNVTCYDTGVSNLTKSFITSSIKWI